MWPYWLIFTLTAIVAFAQSPRPWLARTQGTFRDLRGVWLLPALVIAAFVGLRDEVGGDWPAYMRRWAEIPYMSVEDWLDRGDPGYWLLNWLFHEIGGSIYSVNLVCAALFSMGVVLFCRQQPRPWLALAVAVPYLVIVVGMGYTRQAVALGLSMIGLVALGRGRLFGFLVWMTAAAMFHRSAVILIGLGMLAAPRSGWRGNVFWSVLVGLGLYDAVLSASVDRFVTNYIEAQYQSQGALIRVAMNLVPAILLLLLRNRFKWGDAEQKLWIVMALIAIASMVWLLIASSSTAVDRVALYFIPLQLYVFPRLPDLMTQRGGNRRVWIAVVLIYYASVQFIWLFYSNNAEAWLPYNFQPLRDVF